MKTYEVIGAHRVHDTEPGKTFSANLDPVMEERLMSAGHIKLTNGATLKNGKDNSKERKRNG